MSHQASTYSDAPPIEAGQQVAHLRHLLGQVEAIAGSAGATPGFASLDESARISVAYDRGLPIVRKRFDALAGETITWTATAFEALTRAQQQGDQASAAAAQLARDLEQALRELSQTLHPPEMTQSS